MLRWCPRSGIQTHYYDNKYACLYIPFQTESCACVCFFFILGCCIQCRFAANNSFLLFISTRREFSCTKTMSLPITGSLSRSGGLISAIAKNLRLLNLKAVKRITISFDPFGENVKETR